MSEHKAAPNIRFKGFEDKWKDTIIGKLVKVYDGVHQTPKYKNNGVPFVSVENISNLYTNKFISKSDFENNFKNSKPTSGDLLMTRIGDVGTVNLVKNDNDLAYYVSLALLKPKIKDRKKYINSYFLMYLIESPRTKKELWKRTLHIAFPKKINKNEISKVNLCICLNWKEQQKIGNFFAKLDKLFDLQQQKIDKLDLLKKALLQKLFPKHDADIPELRFKGFNDEWKSYLLGKNAVFINGRAFKQNELLDKGKYPVLRVGNFYTNDKWFYSDLELPEKLYANKGDLLYTWSATFGPHIWKGDKVIYHYHIWKIIFSSEVSKQFALQMLLNDKEELMNNTNGSTMIHLTKNEMEKKVVKIPIKPEQQKIGNLLSKVDQLIELENKKLQNLQQVKKCLLQNMFVD